MTEPLYTLDQARKIGLREVCARKGHEIERFHAEDQAGQALWDYYRCELCDVDITMSYPQLRADGAPEAPTVL
jgi:hypothetical protein